MSNIQYSSAKKAGWQPGKSFWVTSVLWLLFLIAALFTGGFGPWLVLFALFLIATALYSLIFGRKSWLGLPRRKSAGGAVGAGFIVFIVGAVVTGLSAPTTGVSSTLADVEVAVTAASPSSQTPTVKPSPTRSATPSPTRSATPSPTRSATPSPTSTPTVTPSERLVLLTGCFEDGKIAKQGNETVVCTLDDAGVLVWMSDKASKSLLAARVEAKVTADNAARAAAEQAAADEAARVVAQKAADDAAWVAAQQAEVERVAAQKVADDAAWVAAQQAEVDRVAAEQAAQQAPPIQEFVGGSGGGVYYQNCDAVRAAGAAPLYAGQPGFRPKLDGNSNGVACER